MAICDRCNTELSNGEGYCVFSDVQIGFMPVGTLLLCEHCAESLFTNEIWKKATQTIPEIDLSADISEIKQAQRQATNLSIAMCAKRRGLDAAQSRQEAREIAKLWWTDKQAAERQLLAQAATKFPAEVGVSDKVVRQGIDQAMKSVFNEAPKKKWWQFPK